MRSTRALILVAASLLGCEENLDVLSGPPAADAGIDADAATGFDGQAGQSACDGRLAVGEPCTRPADCCSGLCDLDPKGKLSCRPPTGCLAIDEPCSRAGACCSLDCSEKTCGVAGCASIGESCTNPGDCCSDRCEGAMCVPTGAPCKAAGESCLESPECCSKDCVDAPGGGRHCGLLQACRVFGETCGDDGDCCSGRCTLDGAHGYCDELAQCTSSDGKPCKAQVGELCKDDATCCSRSCQTTGQGPKRCAASGGCRAHCETCALDGECCSGTCVVGADGEKRCGPPTGCLPPGEICDKDEQCCGMSPKPRCFEDPPGVGAKRCHDESTATQCEEDGTACVVASQCCGPFCVFEAGALMCLTQCRLDGESCTIRGDCCGEFSDCLVLGGQRVCAPSVK